MAEIALPIIDSRLPMGSLDAYIHRINQIPMLSAEKELELANRLQTTGDTEAAKALILPHLRYVARVARGYLGYGLPLADLMQEGNVGLMKAVKRFDPSRGARLVTFAMHWIKAEIHEYILRNWRIVKVATTKAQRKLFFNLRSMKKRLSWMSENEVNEVAQDLNVKPDTVREMELRMVASDPSFDAPTEASDEDAQFAPAGYLENQSISPEQQLIQSDWSGQATEKMYAGLTQLNERDRDIIQARWLDDDNKATLHDLAAKYNVSAERIRQLEKNALKKLRAAVE